MKSSRFTAQHLWVAVILGSIGLAYLILLAARGQMQPELHPDSQEYLAFRWDSSNRGFGGIRTPGYPLVLQSCLRTLGIEAMPWLQSLAYVAAIVWIASALLRLGFSTAIVLAATIPLIPAIHLTYLAPSILSDSLGLSCSLATVAALLDHLATPSR